MPRIKAVLFDKDGTLVDFNRTWGPATRAVVTRLAAGDAGLMAALAEDCAFVDGSDDLSPRSLIVSDATPVFARPWATILGRAPTADFFAEIDALFIDEVLRSLTPLSSTSALAALAQTGRPLGLATNDSEASARAQMRRLGLDHLLPFIAGYDSGHGAKPEPGMVLAFAAHAGVAPYEVAMVGDTLHDLHAAKAAGALAVAVLTGLTGEAAREELTPHADVVIASLAELESAIG